MNPLLAALLRAGIITQADADRINRSLDPVAARAWADEQMAIAVQNGLSAQQGRLVAMLRQTNGNLSPAMLDDFWRAEDERLFAALRTAIDDVASERAISVVMGTAVDASTWTHVNQAVLDWSHGYYTSPSPSFVGSVPNLNQTSRQQVQAAMNAWQRGELTEGAGGLPRLIRALEPTFGPDRAAVIAATETTRVFAESEHAAAMADPDMDMMRWQTSRDERTCPVCYPLDGVTVPKGHEFAPGIKLPPAHPNCRCSVVALTQAAADAPTNEDRSLLSVPRGQATRQ